jgi:hypothetical protein
VTTKWRKGRRTLFHCDGAACTLQAPLGHQTLTLEGPKLHRRAENQPFPSYPRPTWPPEVKRSGGLAGESTRLGLRLRSRREGKRGFILLGWLVKQVISPIHQHYETLA